MNGLYWTPSNCGVCSVVQDPRHKIQDRSRVIIEVRMLENLRQPIKTDHTRLGPPNHESPPPNNHQGPIPRGSPPRPREVPSALLLREAEGGTAGLHITSKSDNGSMRSKLISKTC